MNVNLSFPLFVWASTVCIQHCLAEDAARAEPSSETRRSDDAKLRIRDAKELARLDAAWQYSLQLAAAPDKLDLAIAWFSGFCANEVNCLPPEDWEKVLKGHAARKLGWGDDRREPGVREAEWPPMKRIAIDGKLVVHREGVSVHVDEATGKVTAALQDTEVRDLVPIINIEPKLVFLSAVDSEPATIVLARSRWINDTYQIGVADKTTGRLRWITTGKAAAKLEGKIVSGGALIETNGEDKSYFGVHMCVCRSRVVVFGWSAKRVFVEAFGIDDGKRVVYFSAGP